MWVFTQCTQYTQVMDVLEPHDLPPVLAGTTAIFYPELLLMPHSCKAPMLKDLWEQHLRQAVLFLLCAPPHPD